MRPLAQSVCFDFQRALPRRTLLKGSGVALAVPWLSAMQAAFGETAAPEPPRRFVAMTLGLGLVGVEPAAQRGDHGGNVHRVSLPPAPGCQRCGI